MTNLEQAARDEAERRWPNPHSPARNVNERRSNMLFAALRDGGTQMSSWLAEYLLSDENVEKAAKALATYVTHGLVEHLEPGPNRDYFMAEARAALSAVLGKEQP